MAKARDVPAAIDSALLEAALFERLVNGVERRVLHQGKVVDRYRVFDDRAALELLAKLMLEKYGPNAGAVEEAGPAVLTREEVMARLDAIRDRSHFESADEPD